MSLSPTLLDHFQSPRNVGEMDGASTEAESENPVCGDVLHLWLRVEDGVITEVRWKAQGCPPTIAAASVMSELLASRSLEAARSLSSDDVERAVGGLPPRKGHAASLAVSALMRALDRLGV